MHMPYGVEFHFISSPSQYLDFNPSVHRRIWSRQTSLHAVTLVLIEPTSLNVFALLVKIRPAYANDTSN